MRDLLAYITLRRTNFLQKILQKNVFGTKSWYCINYVLAFAKYNLLVANACVQLCMGISLSVKVAYRTIVFLAFIFWPECFFCGNQLN